MSARPIIVLSPHCDDAACSLGATLLGHGLGGSPTRCVSIFSWSSYTRHSRRCDPQETTLQRKREEAAVARLAGYEPAFVDLPDTAARYLNPDLPDDVNAGIEKRIAEFVRVIIQLVVEEIYRDPRLLLVPLALGGHVDHVIVRDSALAAVKRCRFERIGLYEDLPYAGRLESAALERECGKICRGLGLRPRIFRSSTLEEKVKLIALYESQLDPGWLSEIAGHWRRIGGERIWLSPAVQGTAGREK